MAADIIPIQLSLTKGDVVTLWAPTWEEDGEDWEAFLGHGDRLYVLPDAAHLAAFIRSDAPHDLTDHPSWPVAKRALADELVADDDHRFDIVGIPELVAEPPNVWSLAELADTVAMLHSLAEVCDLPAVEEILASSAGFSSAAIGQAAFLGRAGKKLWNEVGKIVASRWDTVIETLDGIIAEPETDDDAVATAVDEIESMRRSAAAVARESDSVAVGHGDDVSPAEEVGGANAGHQEQAEERDPDLDFWDEVGIDCVSITVDGRTGWTLRCYLDDTPVFLSTGERIQLHASPAALETYLADASAENSLSHLDAWATIREAIDGGEASVIAGPENQYRLDGLRDDLLAGPELVDAGQLELAVELLQDAADSRGDEEPALALGSSTALGNLVRAITHPDPNRLPPSPPFDDEVAAWDALVSVFSATLDWK